MKSWYEIKAKQDSADIYIYDELGLFGVAVSQLVSEIAALKGKALNVYINSPGGPVFDGIAVFNALSRHEGGVNVIVDGLAASVASVIAQAGTSRTMGKASALMVHDAWGVAIGDAGVMEKARDQFEAASNQVSEIYAAKAGGTPEEWRQKMMDETWYRGQEAVDAGLADVAIGAIQNAYAGRVFNLSKFNKVPEWVNQDPIDPAKPGDEPEIKEDDVDEKAIRQALGLDEEGDILAAVTGLHTEIAQLKATLKDQDPPGKDENRTLKRELAESQMSMSSSRPRRTRRSSSSRTGSGSRRRSTASMRRSRPGGWRRRSARWCSTSPCGSPRMTSTPSSRACRAWTSLSTVAPAAATSRTTSRRPRRSPSQSRWAVGTRPSRPSRG